MKPNPIIEQMTPRQRERLELLKIEHTGLETIDEAADLLRSAIGNVLCPPIKRSQLPETAFACVSEGDPSNCRQWES